jgi:hypothetical protein
MVKEEQAKEVEREARKVEDEVFVHQTVLIAVQESERALNYLRNSKYLISYGDFAAAKRSPTRQKTSSVSSARDFLTHHHHVSRRQLEIHLLQRQQLCVM